MSNVNVLFFASLRELVGRGELSVDVSTLDELKVALHAELGDQVMGDLSESNIRVALNQNLIDAGADERDVMLKDGDEVAFLPPVTGG